MKTLLIVVAVVVGAAAARAESPAAPADAGTGRAVYLLTRAHVRGAMITPDGRCFAALPDGGAEEDRSAFCAAVADAFRQRTEGSRAKTSDGGF